MSESAGMLIFGAVGLIIILPIVAIAAVYYLGRQNKNKFQRVIEMDGTQCLQARDGGVVIKSKIWINLFALIFFVATLGVCGFMVVANLSQGVSMVIEQVVLAGVWALIAVPVIVHLGRALGRPAFYFNPERQALEIRQGLSKRQIPFGQMVKLAVDAWQKDIGWVSGLFTGFYQPQSLPGVRIKLELADGEAIELGALSSLKNQEEVRERCRQVCQVVADATGLSLPLELLAGNS